MISHKADAFCPLTILATVAFWSCCKTIGPVLMSVFGLLILWITYRLSILFLKFTPPAANEGKSPPENILLILYLFHLFVRSSFILTGQFSFTHATYMSSCKVLCLTSRSICLPLFLKLEKNKDVITSNCIYSVSSSCTTPVHTCRMLSTAWQCAFISSHSRAAAAVVETSSESEDEEVEQRSESITDLSLEYLQIKKLVKYLKVDHFF